MYLIIVNVLNKDIEKWILHVVTFTSGQI